MPGAFGQGPGVLAFLIGEEAFDVSDGVVPWFGAGELAADQFTDFVEYLGPFTYFCHTNIIAHGTGLAGFWCEVRLNRRER